MPKSQQPKPEAEAYESCKECGGTGKKTEMRNEETIEIDCPRCGGTGRTKIPIKIKPALN
jgi:DnaJ-class molecular chaperone